MKFKLKQEKLEELLEKLSVVDMYPSSVIAIKKGDDGKAVMFSIQREASGRALRYLKVNDTFFDEIEVPEKQEAIEIDAIKVLKAIKKFLPGTNLVVSVDGDKLVVTGLFEDKNEEGEVTNKRELSHNLNYSEPAEVQTSLPIDFKDGIPHVGKNKVPLDTEIKINLEDLKTAVELASVYDTEYFTFDLPKKQKLTMRIGALRSFSEFCTYQPKFNITAGESFKSIYTYGIKQLLSVMRFNDITMRASNEAPCWIYEKADDYTLGILMPPHVPTEEEVV